jgi:hypothetical protein
MSRLDEKLPLTIVELKKRFRQTKALKSYLARPLMRFEQSYEEAKVRAELEQRNQLRAEAKLPLAQFEDEVGRLRAVFESDRSAEFHSLSYDMVCELYGKPQAGDFSSLSDMAWFFTSKRNLIKKMLLEN